MSDKKKNTRQRDAVLRLRAVYEAARMRERLRLLKEQQDTLKTCGLDKEAHALNEPIKQLNLKIKDKLGEAYQQRKRLVKAMLFCFAAGDLATAIADKMHDLFRDITLGEDRMGGQSLAQMFAQQADDWNKCVQMIDGDKDHGSERVSMYYSELAEELVSEVIPVMDKVITKYMTSDKGKRLL